MPTMTRPSGFLKAVREKTLELGEGDLEEVPDEPEPRRTGGAPGVGRYIDAGEIGSGGTARVHRMQDDWLHRGVAMKVLTPAMTKDPASVSRFMDEAQIQAQLEHPNVPPMYDLVVEPNGAAFFTMKLVRGTSLHDWLEVRTRPVGSSERLGEGLEIFLKVCDAVAFAHSKGVLHRDLKPENVMLGEFGEVYVVDWGIAVARGGTVKVKGKVRATNERFLAGTPGFMSPEAARGEPGDERSDVFGLGAILYAIVTGKRIYGDINPTQTLAAARSGTTQLDPAAFTRAGASRKLVHIIASALAPEPEDRYQSVSALQAVIHRFMRGGLTMPRRTFEVGAHIITQGDTGDQAFIVLEGACEVVKTTRGRRQVVGTLGPGDVFGETAVLSDSLRTASVVALDRVTLLVIDRAAVEDGLGYDTWLGKLVNALAQRFRELDARAKSTDSL